MLTTRGQVLSLPVLSDLLNISGWSESTLLHGFARSRQTIEPLGENYVYIT